jgi:hypothetical protein
VTGEAKTVLGDIFTGCEGLIEIRPLPPGRHAIRFFPTVNDAERYARSLDGKIDVYFGAGTRLRESGTKEDVQEIPAVWADCDSPEAVAKVPTFPLRPTIEIESSPGRLHVWWLLKEPILIEGEGQIASVEGVLRGIADNLGSDPAVCEVARIMRVPDTMNVKRGAPCRLLHNDGPRHDLADFINLGIHREKVVTSGNGAKPERLDTAGVLAGVPEGQRDRNLFRLVCKLRRADVPQELVERIVTEAAENCAPPFPAEAARAKVIRAYQRYPAASAVPEQPADDAKPVRELSAALDIGALLCAPPEAPPWVIEPLLARGEIVVVAGEPGIGKSWLLADLALALVVPHDFLAVLPVAGGPYRVMVVDLENSPRLVRYRIRKLLRALNLDTDAAKVLPLAYHCQASLDLGDPADRLMLFGAVESFRPDFVMIDSLVRCHRGDENSNSAMRDLFAELARLKDYDSGAIVSHHLAKPSKERPADDVRYRIRGASDILSVVDEAWGLQREADGFELVHEKTRWDRPSGNLVVSIEDVQEGEGVRLVATESLRLVSGTVDRLLIEGGKAGAFRPFMLDEIMKAGAGKKATADKALTRELGRRYARGLVKKSGNKGGMRYWLAEHAPEDAE